MGWKKSNQYIVPCLMCGVVESCIVIGWMCSFIYPGNHEGIKETISQIVQKFHISSESAEN